MNLIEKTVYISDKKSDMRSVFFRIEEGIAIIGPDDFHWWEKYGDRFLSFHLNNGKIIHLSFKDDIDRQDNLERAVEWWSK